MNFEYGMAGIKYEDYVEFEKSYNSSIYQMAFRKMTDIIRRNIEVVDKKRRGQSRYDYHELPNVLSFVGGRGSGKTSVMLSFAESLKQYHWMDGKKELKPKFSVDVERKVRFTCLDCIDGSLLEKGEDIFKIVMAQMYQRFLEVGKESYYVRTEIERRDRVWKSETEGEMEYQKRELQESFEKLYKRACTLDALAAGEIHAGESYMSSLNTLARSQKIREEFEELVRIYLSFMRMEGRSSSIGQEAEHYLVVTVDDVDLNIQNGFQMLEKIHRYLMVPNIIVLLSMDYEQMLALCKKNFFKILPKADRGVKTEGIQRINEVTTDYLDKVMPMNYRVYMHGSAKFKSKGKLLGDLLKVSGVCFDSQGLKLHFYEQKSIRNVLNFQMTLEMMEPLCAGDVDSLWADNIGEEKARICEANHHILESDLRTRMLLEKVELEEHREFLKKVMRENLHRSMQKVIEYARSIIQDKPIIIDEGDATYGALLNAMYGWGRIENGSYKQMVHCLLAYYSYAFTRLYIWGKGDAESKKEFLAIISGSVAGTWAEDMLPMTLIRSNEERPIEEDALFPGERRKKAIAFDQFRMKPLRRLLGVSLKATTSFESKEEKEGYVKNLIYEIEILFMSIVGLKNGGSSKEKYVVRVKERITQRTARIMPSLEIYREDGGRVDTNLSGRFDIFGFVENSMMYEERLQTFEKELKKALEGYYGVEKLSPQGLLLFKYKQWERKYHDNLPIPVYWLDMIYNIMKRVRREAKIQNPSYVSDSQLFEYIGQIYKAVYEELDKQEEFYKEHLNNDNVKFAEKFKECPYVKYFFGSPNKEDKRNLFKELAYRMNVARDL